MFSKSDKPRIARADTSRIVRFTDAWVKAMIAGNTRASVEYQDAGNTKLRARVGLRAVTFSVYLWNRQTQKPQRIHVAKITSAKAPEWTVVQVREEAKRLTGEVASGQHSATSRMEGNRSTSAALRPVSELLSAYIAERQALPNGLSRISADKYRYELPAMLGARYGRPINELTPDAVLALYRERITPAERPDALGVVRKVGSVSGARTAICVLSALCRYYDLPNLTTVARRKRAVQPIGVRRARLGVEEARQLVAWCWNIAGTDDGTSWNAYVAMIGLSIVTGWRRRTLCALRWDWIDWKAATITIPAVAFKCGREYVLPIGPKTLALLKSRRKSARTPDGLIFPSPRDESRGVRHLTSFANQLPFACGAHDGRKVFSLVLDRFASVMVKKILMTHTADDVDIAHYLMAHPWSELLADTRPAMLRVEKIMLSAVGDPVAVNKATRLHERRRNAHRARASVGQQARVNCASTPRMTLKRVV